MKFLASQVLILTALIAIARCDSDTNNDGELKSEKQNFIKTNLNLIPFNWHY